MKPCAGGNGSNDQHKRNRKPGREPAAEQDARHHEDRQAGTLHTYRRRPSQELPKLVKRAVRNDVHAKHAAEHGDADLNPDAGQKSDQRRARQEVGEEAQL